MGFMMFIENSKEKSFKRMILDSFRSYCMGVDTLFIDMCHYEDIVKIKHFDGNTDMVTYEHVDNAVTEQMYLYHFVEKYDHIMYVTDLTLKTRRYHQLDRDRQVEISNKIKCLKS